MQYWHPNLGSMPLPSLPGAAPYPTLHRPLWNYDHPYFYYQTPTTPATKQCENCKSRSKRSKWILYGSTCLTGVICAALFGILLPKIDSLRSGHS